MTDKPTLHIPLKDSPETFLLDSILAADTILPVADSSIFEAAGITRLTLGIDTETTETVTVVSYEVDNEIVVVRGTPAYSWLSGTKVTRLLNAVDISEIQQFLNYLDEHLVTNANSHDHSSGDGAQIPTGGIENSAVTEDKLADDAVTNDKLAADSVNTAQILNDAVSTEKILDDAITNAKLSDPYDILMSVALDKDTALEIANEIGEPIFIPDIHDGKKAVRLWAGISGSNVSSSGNVEIRFYDVDSVASLGTVTITQGNRTGYLDLAGYTLTKNRRIRIDCISAGTGVQGIHVQIKVDKT